MHPESQKPERESMALAPQGERPTEQPEFRVIFDEAKEQAMATAEAVTEQTDALFAEREERLATLKNEVGVADVEALRELEERIAPLELKLQKLKRVFRRMVPFVVPLAFAAKLTRSELLSHEGTFDKRAVAAEQLKRDGITDERKAAYTSGVSELLYHGITPVGYQDTWQVVSFIPENVMRGREQVRKSTNSEREDAWRLYLGLPQERGTFGVSEYKPEQSKENIYYYKINGWFEKFKQAQIETNGEKNFFGVKEIVNGIRQTEEHREEFLKIEKKRVELERTLEELQKKIEKKFQNFKKQQNIQNIFTDKQMKQWEKMHRQEDIELDAAVNERQMLKYRRIDLIGSSWIEDVGKDYVISSDQRSGEFGVMGQFKLSLGQDKKGSYISYYDKWDLGGNKVEGEKGLFGKPFEIYDRIYYDPVTFEVVQEK